MSLLKSFRPSALLGLALEGNQLEGGVLQKVNGRFRVVRTFRSALSLDPLTNDAELVGREIRNQLDEARLHERRCTVCLPLQWVLTLQVKVPEIPEADVPGFLQLEAERGFPYAPDDLSISTSLYRAPNGEQHATLTAIPKSHLTSLDKALRAAKLKLVSFSLGIPVLQEPGDASADTLLTLAVGDHSVEIQVTINGGVAALRTLEGAFEPDSLEKHIDADLVAREIRITLGQLPRELRELVSRIRVYGRRELTGPLVREITPLAQEMGLLVDVGIAPKMDGCDAELLSQSSLAAALNLAARHLTGSPPGFEFLPPRVSQLKLIINRFGTGKLAYAGASASAVALVMAGVFIWQQVQLSGRESEWRRMKNRVTEVEGIKQKIGKFRAWYDETQPGLRILREITETFPEDGSVFIKNLKIKELSEVSCSGTARDERARARLQEELGKKEKATDVKFTNIRPGQTAGQTKTLQFDLSFRWMDRRNKP